MIINLLIIAFLGLTMYWWGAQGVLSAVLHFVAVVVAGALALAIWEPLTVGFFLNGQFSAYAWCVGLLGPFLLILLIVRIALDKIVRGNLYFSTFVNSAVGGAIGLVIGILTAGLTVIALGFLPLPNNLAGFEPMSISQEGKIVGRATDTLWIPVNRISCNFFSILSTGAFSPAGESRPLALYQPDLADQSARHRLKEDPNSSQVAAPDDVTINEMQVMPSPLQGLDDRTLALFGQDGRREGMKVVVVNFSVKLSRRGTYDSGDQAVRIPPAQVRLISTPADQPDNAEEVMVHDCIGFNMPAGETSRVLTMLMDNKTVPASTASEAKFGWVFAIHNNRAPRFMLFRHTRFNLPETPARPDAAAFASALGAAPRPLGAVADPGKGGTTPTPTGPSTPGTRIGARTGTFAESITVGDYLPTPLSKNLATGLETRDTALVSGEGTIRPAEGSISKAVIIDRVWAPSHQAVVRMELKRDAANSLLGAARVAAASIQGFYLTDEKGGQYFPIGYAWAKADKSMQIKFVSDRTVPLQSAREFPVSQMGPTDTITVYFVIPRVAPPINFFKTGSGNTGQAIDPPLRIPAEAPAAK